MLAAALADHAHVELHPPSIAPWAVLDALPQSLAIVDGAGAVRWRNAAWARLDPADRFACGARFDEACERFFDPGPARGALLRGIGEVRSGQSQLMELECGAGSSVLGLSAVPLEVDGARGLVVEARDVTARSDADAAVRESEARYRTLVDGSPDIVFITDASSRMIYANHALEEQTGYTAADFQMRQQDNDLLHPDDAPRVAQFIADFVATDRRISDRLENRFVSRRGETLWYSSVLSKTVFHGQPALQFVVQNVTESKRRELEAQRSARRLTILTEVSQALAGARLDSTAVRQVIVRTVSEVTASACGLRLLSEDGQWLDVVAVHHRDPEASALAQQLMATEPRQPVKGYYRELVESKRPVVLPEISLEQLRATAPPAYWPHLERFRFTSLLVVPLLIEDRVIGSFAIAGDRPLDDEDRQLVVEIAERAALAIESARRYEHEQRAVRVRDEFVAVASHELRTPLTSLQFAVQATLRLARQGTEISPAFIDMLTTAERQTRRLRRLVDLLLDVARLDADRLEVVRAPVDLAAIARDVVSTFQHEALAAGCALTLHAGAPVTGLWDAGRLEQILSNLLANAIKYGARRPIEVTVDEAAGRARLVVRDHGIGIPLDRQPRIFERFERAVPREHYGGFGLGLYIVRLIVEALGGTVGVHSAPDAGSTFTVELPQAPPPPP